MILIYIRYINKKTLPNIRIYLTIKTLYWVLLLRTVKTHYILWINAISNKWLRQLVTIYKIYRSKLLITYIKLLYQLGIGVPIVVLIIMTIYRWWRQANKLSRTGCWQLWVHRQNFGLQRPVHHWMQFTARNCHTKKMSHKPWIRLAFGLKVILWSNHWTQIKFFLYLFDLGRKQNVKYSLYL